MAAPVQQQIIIQAQQEDPLLVAAENEATVQVNAIFDGLDAQGDTYIQTANKCAQLFTDSPAHKHAMEWIAFLNKIESYPPAWQTITDDDVEPRVKVITILGIQRESIKKEMEAELPGVLDSLRDTITNLNTITNLTKNALASLKRCNYEGMAELKEKFLTILTSKIHFDKISAKLDGLPSRIETSYQSLKGCLQAAIYPLVGSSTERFSVKSYPTVDRLRGTLLQKEPHLASQHPFRADDDDFKEE